MKYTCLVLQGPEDWTYVCQLVGMHCEVVKIMRSCILGPRNNRWFGFYGASLSYRIPRLSEKFVSEVVSGRRFSMTHGFRFAGIPEVFGRRRLSKDEASCDLPSDLRFLRRGGPTNSERFFLRLGQAGQIPSGCHLPSIYLSTDRRLPLSIWNALSSLHPLGYNSFKCVTNLGP